MTHKRKLELSTLAHYRAVIILENGWEENTGEFADEENLTDEELEYVLNCSFNVEPIQW